MLDRFAGLDQARCHGFLCKLSRGEGETRLAKGVDIAPIPGTKRVSRVQENVAADGIQLSAEQREKLDNLTPAAGAHHNEEQMRLLKR